MLDFLFVGFKSQMVSNCYIFEYLWPMPIRGLNSKIPEQTKKANDEFTASGGDGTEMIKKEDHHVEKTCKIGTPSSLNNGTPTK